MTTGDSIGGRHGQSGGEERTPTAEGMRARAASFVEEVGSPGGVRLDYSVASLRLVDRIIDGLRAGRREHGRQGWRHNGRQDRPEDGEPTGSTLTAIGAYVGEVLVRQAGAAWVDFNSAQTAYFGHTVGVRMPDGRLWNPVGKTHNRFRSGAAEDSLHTFYLLLPGRPRRSVDSLGNGTGKGSRIGG